MTAKSHLMALLPAGALLLAACSGNGAPRADADRQPTADTAPTARASVDRKDLDLAVSETREDSYYPDVGDPGVDALHYELSLFWDPEARELSASELLTFRSTETAAQFQLDFGEPLKISSLTVDGEQTEYEQDGTSLVVSYPVRADQEYEFAIEYAGTPEPVDAPGQRLDMSDLGWHVTDEGETWTMQEPFGAFTWYAVNDQPADKALYDFTLHVDSPQGASWSGVANGELQERTEEGGRTITRWHLAEPAASYLVTVAFGDYEMTEDEAASGIPITYWTPPSDPGVVEALSITPEAMAWVENILGPYPFDTFGVVVVDSESGMETQTMVTLGNTDYTLSSAVVVHELVHQWYGNQVTPNDWRDVWMNEGMATYLQGMWEAEQTGTSLERMVRAWALTDKQLRFLEGPPGAYLDHSFGGSNVYYSPAVMFHDLRKMVGDAKFFAMVRGWPAANDNATADREEFVAYMEKSTGAELTKFINAWLLGKKTPARA